MENICERLLLGQTQNFEINCFAKNTSLCWVLRMISINKCYHIKFITNVKVLRSSSIKSQLQLSKFSEMAFYFSAGLSRFFLEEQQDSWKVVNLCSNVSASLKKHIYNPIHLTNHKKGALVASRKLEKFLKLSANVVGRKIFFWFWIVLKS